MRPITVTVGDLVDDDNGIAESQTPSSGAYVTLDGALASDGTVTLDSAQQVVITSAGDDTLVTFTITGKNQDNQPITEDVTGTNTSAATSTNYFTYISSILVTGNIDVSIIVGVLATNGSISHTIQTDWRQPNFTAGLALVLTGSPSCTVQQTWSDIQNTPYEDWVWFSHGQITNVTTNTQSNYNAPVIGVRLKLNSGYTSGSASLTYVQAIGD